MTDDKLRELVPDVGTHDMNLEDEYMCLETPVKEQTENLRRAVKGLLNVYDCDNTAVRKIRINSVLKQITGKKYTEI